MSQLFIQICSDDVNTTVTGCMLIMTDVVLNSEWTDAHALHKQVLKRIVHTLSDFQASPTIEVERTIKSPDQFHEYFRTLDLFDGETDTVLVEQFNKAREEFSRFASRECFETLLYRSIGCISRCPACGIKCELPTKNDASEEHNHLHMAFNGRPLDEQFHPYLFMCYQQWNNKNLFRGDNSMSSSNEFFLSEAPDWYRDVNYKLLKEFELRDQQSYHSGVWPTLIPSVPNDYEVLWEPL